ncbi:MAG TPA: M20 family metallopeptidase [Candidatus Xenobia bacterium]|nr:M20 family metallopeptidase [Candidatus Xenobia bacterium]
MSVRALYKYLRPRQAEMVKLLSEVVSLESPSTQPAAVAKLAEFLAGRWRSGGATVQLLPTRGRGPILRAELFLSTGRPDGQLLVLGHMDTVYELGTLKRMPFTVRRGRAHGPGTVDMKSGLVQALFAVDALKALKLVPRAKLVFLFTSDEEVGSAASRALIEREARRSRAVLVLEPATGLHGALKTARKGVGEFEVIVEGRAAHAGVEPEKGVNAIHELAAQILRVAKLARPARGLTLNVDVVEGGTRTNVVAEHARALVDVRIARMTDGRWIERQMRQLKPNDKRARLIVRGGVNRPPLERTPPVVRLFRHAQRLADELGVKLDESATGGGSDGNFTAGLGVPTLDGLGGVGLGLHSPAEFVVARRMPERAALLAGLLLTL